MGPLAGTLSAISMGAVYMGALTYIGNAPNFMVLAIAEEHGHRACRASSAISCGPRCDLLPLFLLLTLLPMSPMLKLS